VYARVIAAIAGFGGIVEVALRERDTKLDA